MTKIRRFFALLLLISLLSIGAWADGGETQGPSLPLPAPTASPTPTPESQQAPASLDLLTLAALLLKAIL
jgi:hypothetical protein